MKITLSRFQKHLSLNWQLVICLAFAVFLTACGGSSGDSENESSQQDVSEDVDAQGTNGSSQDNNNTGNDVDTNEETDASDPVDEVSRPIALFADGGPALGIPGGFIEGFRLFGIDDSGAMLASATVRGSVRGTVAWAGSASNPYILYQNGDPLSESTPDLMFTSLIAGSAANDGSLAVVVNTQADSNALVVIDATGKQVLLKVGDSTEGPFDDVLDGPQVITNILSVRNSSAGLLVLVEFEIQDGFGRTGRVWLEQTSGGFKQLIRSFESFIGSTALGPSTQVDGVVDCRLYSKVGDSRSNDGDALFGLADTGHILIDAVRVCGTSVLAQTESVVARRDLDGQWKTIVLSGSAVPGAPEAIYGEVMAHSLSDENAQILVRAELDLPDLISPPANFTGSVQSYWVHPISGNPRLVSLEGETIQVANESQLLSAAIGIVDQRNEMVSLSQRFGFFGSVGMLLRGVPHSIQQPHASVAAPGASSLSVIAAVGTAGFTGLPDGSVFTELSAAELDESGNLYFVGVLDPQSVNAEVERGLWRADANGHLNLIVSENDEVSISGVPRPLGALLIDISRSGGSLLRATDDGDLFLITRLGGAATGSSALIRVPASFIQ